MNPAGSVETQAVAHLPTQAKLTVTKKKVTKTVGTKRTLNLHVALGRRALPRKARIVLSITRATRVGRELRYSLATPGHGPPPPAGVQG